jgi:hypothetical protein
MGFSSWKIGEPSKRVVTTVLISGLELVYADVELWSTSHPNPVLFGP